MRGDSIAAVWPTLNLIRDIYTQAASGVTVLTWCELSLWDCFTAFRAASYARISYQIQT